MACDVIFDEQLDEIIEKIYALGESKKRTFIKVDPKLVWKLVQDATDAFTVEKVLLRTNPPAVIVGDIFGDLQSVIYWFKRCGTPYNTRYIFLGNFTNKSKNSLEVLLLLLIFKLRYPGNIFLLRGGFESPDMCDIHGFRAECEYRYGLKMYDHICGLFSWLPVACVINDALCVHGGISSRLHRLEDIARLERPLHVPASGLLVDLLWAGLNPNCGFSELNQACVFGPDVVCHFLDYVGLKYLIRSSPYLPTGHKYFANQRVHCLFSARNFENKGNTASVLYYGNYGSLKVLTTEKTGEGTTA